MTPVQSLSGCLMLAAVCFLLAAATDGWFRIGVFVVGAVMSILATMIVFFYTEG